MKYRISLLALGAVLLSLACCVSGECGDADMPSVPVIRLPMTSVSVQSDEQQVVTTLPADTLWVVESTRQLLVLSSPVGLVSITSDTGPMKIMAKFADGDGGVELRTYGGPYLYFVQAVGKGQTEILIVPVGVSSEAEITRQMLTVAGPRPPPDDDKVDPVPPIPPKPTAEHVRLVVIEDTLNRSPETAILLNQLVGWTAFLDSGNEYRLYDQTTGEAKGKQAKIDAGTTPLPAMVIYDKSSGAILKVGALSPTIDELRATIGGLTGG